MKPIDPTHRDRVDRLRADLREFTVDAVNDLLGPVASAALGREHPLPARRARPVPPRSAGHPDLRLRPRGRVPRRRLAEALPRLGVDGARRLGLVPRPAPTPTTWCGPPSTCAHTVRSTRSGHADWWLVSDPGELATGGRCAENHVLGVGGASTHPRSLARSARPVGRVLDLGTGCGVQALHAARHARSVVATDAQRRALAHRRAHPGPERVADDGRAAPGWHLLEPVRGERFDLVVSNPPFVITPRRAGVPAYEYRDGGLVGDELVRR